MRYDRIPNSCPGLATGPRTQLIWVAFKGDTASAPFQLSSLLPEGFHQQLEQLEDWISVYGKPAAQTEETIAMQALGMAALDVGSSVEYASAEICCDILKKVSDGPEVPLAYELRDMTTVQQRLSIVGCQLQLLGSDIWIEEIARLDSALVSAERIAASHLAARQAQADEFAQHYIDVRNRAAEQAVSLSQLPRKN